MRQISLSLVVLTAMLTAMPTAKIQAGIAYGDPDGGWAYTFEGADASNDFDALDGGWTYGGGSDSWDGSEIGDGAPGGVSALTEGDTTFIRMQDTGNPVDYPDETGVTGDPSNRKLYFDRDIVDLDGINEEFLEEGFTFSFRGRISTAATGPIDPWYPDDASGSDDWPEAGLGEHIIEFDSTAHISFFQPGNIGSLGFALTTEEGPTGVGENGFLMNDLTDNFPCANCGDTGAGDLNLVEISNINEWQEFWITIEPSADGPGTHKVNVYLNGSADAMEFDVTAGVRHGDGGLGPLSIGNPGTSKASAWDLDFISIANGVHLPGGGGVDGDFNGNGALDVEDINMLTEASASNANDQTFDVTGDSNVNSDDVKAWIKDLANSWVGDADVNGEFNSGDLVAVFQAGKFETGLAANWKEGDWDGDGIFGSSDFVLAFQDGGFEQGPRAAVQSVPEPNSLLLILIGSLMIVRRRRICVA